MLTSLEVINRRIITKIKRLFKQKIIRVVPGIIPISILKEYLPNNPVIIEAGAHIGNDTIKIANLWPKGEIHAFEPIPELFSHLKKNTKRFTNIICYPIALSNTTGHSQMHVSSGASDGSSSLLIPNDHLKIYPKVHFNRTIQVKTITLNDWAIEKKISQIDFFWLDLQGHELSVLKDAKNLLETTTAIYTEVNLVKNYHECGLYAELRRFLEGNEFQVKQKALDWVDGGNVLFVKG